MKTLTSDYSKRVFKRLPQLFGFVFALYLIISSSTSVFAFDNIPLPNTDSFFIVMHDDSNNNNVLDASETLTLFTWIDNTVFGGVKLQPQYNVNTFKFVDNLGIQKPTLYRFYTRRVDSSTWNYVMDLNAYQIMEGEFVKVQSSNRAVVNVDDLSTPFYTPIPPVPVASVVKFIQPNKSPFLDTTTGYNFLISYKVPNNTSIANVLIDVHCPDFEPTDWEITGQEYNILNGEGWIKCFVKNVPVGIHTITATVNTLVASTIIERLGGSVDANGDGIDDRTNQPVDNGSVTNNPGAPTNVVDSVNSLTGFMSTMKTFSSQLFAFMPTEVKVIMITVITIGGFIAIKKFIL